MLKKIGKFLGDLWEGWKTTPAFKVTIPGHLLLDVYSIPGEEIICEDTFYLEMVENEVQFTKEPILVEVNRKKTKCRFPDGTVRRFLSTGQLYGIPDHIWMKELEEKPNKTPLERVELALLKATRSL